MARPTHAVSAIMEVDPEAGDGGYLYVRMGGHTIGIPLAGPDDQKVQGIDSLAAVVKQKQVA